MVPMRGCSRGSTTSVREVPMASGWPGQSAASADCAAAQLSMPMNKPARSAVDDRLGNLTSTLAIIEPRLHSKANFGPHKSATEVLVLVVACRVLFKQTGISPLSLHAVR